MPIANLGDEIDLYYWSSACAQVNAGDNSGETVVNQNGRLAAIARRRICRSLCPSPPRWRCSRSGSPVSGSRGGSGNASASTR